MRQVLPAAVVHVDHHAYELAFQQNFQLVFCDPKPELDVFFKFVAEIHDAFQVVAFDFELKQRVGVGVDSLGGELDAAVVDVDHLSAVVFGELDSQTALAAGVFDQLQHHLVVVVGEVQSVDHLVHLVQ